MLWIGDGKPVGGWGVWWAGEAVWLILCSIGWWEGVEVANETSTRCLMYAGKGTLWMLLMLMLPS